MAGRTAIPLRLRPAKGAGVVARLLYASTVLAGLLVLVSLISLSNGPVDIAPLKVAAIILEPLGLHLADYERTEELVVERIRVPRILVGALTGAALGVAGATMQGLFRNPMADPGIIGVSAGGALGAVLAIALGAAGGSVLALPAAAFLGALGTAFLVYGIGASGGRLSMATLLLAGVAVSAFISATISAVILAVDEPGALRSILFWLAGGLDSRSWDHVWISLPFILLGLLVVLVFARDLNVLMLGDDEAQSAGVNVTITRPLLLTAASLVTGAAVAVSGTIAFVGLVVPHMLRLVAGPDHRVLIPVSALGGAVFVVSADFIGRVALSPAEIRVGIITSFVGAPFFIFLLIRNKRRAEAF